MGDAANTYYEIVNLMGRLNFAIDQRDLDLSASAWTEDGSTVQYLGGEEYRRIDGRDAMVEYLRQLWVALPVGRRHFSTNIWIDSDDGETVMVTSYMAMISCSESPASIVTTGWYHDEVVRVDGEWRFRKRTLHLDAPTGHAQLVR